jgi:uncharacterized membrane protein
MAFVVLIIPFQFGVKWLTLGWLAEGLAVSLYGILKNDKAFKHVGFTISGLCLASFIWFDVIAGDNGIFTQKYFAITAASIIILAAYIYKGAFSGMYQKLYKYAVIVNLWFFMLHICYKSAFELQPYSDFYNVFYFAGALAVFLTFSLAYAAPRIKIISDTGVKIISALLYPIGILALFGLNNTLPLYLEYSSSVFIISNAVMAAVSLLSVFALHDLVKLIILERKFNVEWYPLVVSAYFIVLLTHILIELFYLPVSSMWLTIIYVLTALAWIIFGFAKRYSLIRKIGLGLALMSVVKLFIIDLSSLTSGHQIISYFSLGAVLIAISFVYQYFNKRLELQDSSGLTDRKEGKEDE